MSTEESTPSEREDPSEGASFPIVGVGASAGGLESFTQLLKALPIDTGMAFVLVPHLAPTHASVEPNRVYVIPPGKCMTISRGVLQLVPREGHGVSRPIDQFFRALAEDARHQAIGVILSGTASDGTLGLEAIKAEGGITFAQDETAQHEGMPQSAIASVCVDFVLPPDDIARDLVRIAQHPHAAPRLASGDPPEEEANLTKVVRLLQQATGVDFTHYKVNTFSRRSQAACFSRKWAG